MGNSIFGESKDENKEAISKIDTHSKAILVVTQRQKDLAAAAADLIVDPEDPRFGKAVGEEVDKKLAFTTSTNPQTGRTTVLIAGKALDSETAADLYKFRAEAMAVGQEFRMTHPKSWRAKTAEWIAKNEPTYTKR